MINLQLENHKTKILFISSTFINITVEFYVLCGEIAM